MGKIKGWTLIKTPRRKLEKTDKRDGVIHNGEGNDYPSRMENFVNNSITAKMCSNMYARFIKGIGFEDATLNKIVIGIDTRTGKKVTSLQLLHAIAREFSRHSGAWVKVGYNGNLKSTALELVTSKYCRFGKKDDEEYSGKILIYDNWGSDNPDEKFDKTKIVDYNTYSSNEDVLKYQITGKKDASESEVMVGLQDWKGQVYMQFLDDEYTYPLSFIDPVQHDADTEFQISLFKNGELRRGFFAKYIMAYDEFEEDEDRDQFEADIKSFEGAGESGSILMIEGLERDSDNKYIMPLKLEKVEQNINDKLFETYEKSTSNNIRKAYNNIPPILVDYQEGKLGNTSGEAISEAVDFYNSQTRADRMVVEKIFTELFSNWHDEKYSDKNWKIKEIDDISATTSSQIGTGSEPTSEIDEKRLESQAALLGSVGGVQGILQIQQAVSNGTSDYNAALEILKTIFGFSEDEARKILGTPEKDEPDDTNNI